jgi:hypothetical protein
MDYDLSPGGNAMQALKTLWDLLKEMLSKRWVRYLVAALFCIFGVLLALQALIGMQIQTVSGVIRTIEIRRDAQSGEYKEHLLTLDSGNTHYTLEAGYFIPTLGEDTLREGEQIDLWYEQTPPFDPDIVAIQVYDVQGGPPTKYVTDAYAHPQNTRTSNLVTGGVFVLLGLLAIAAAIWLPMRDESGGERKGGKPAEQLASAPRYGEWVVGPPASDRMLPILAITPDTEDLPYWTIIVSPISFSPELAAIATDSTA